MIFLLDMQLKTKIKKLVGFRLIYNMNVLQNILLTCTILITFNGWQSINNIAAIISFAVSIHCRTRQTWNKCQLNLLYGKYGNSLRVYWWVIWWCLEFRVNKINNQIQKTSKDICHAQGYRIEYSIITYHKQGSWCWHQQEESHGEPWQPRPWHWWKCEDFYFQLSIFWFHLAWFQRNADNNKYSLFIYTFYRSHFVELL